MPVVPNRPQPPSRHLPWRGGTAGPPPGRHPREEAAAAAAAVSPLAPFSRLCCGNRAGSRAHTHRHGKRERGESRGGGSCAEPGPLPRCRPAPAQRRPGPRAAGRGEAAPQRGGKGAGRRDLPGEEPLRRGLSAESQKPGGWKRPVSLQPLTEHHRVSQTTALSDTSSLS